LADPSRDRERSAEAKQSSAQYRFLAMTMAREFLSPVPIGCVKTKSGARGMAPDESRDGAGAGYTASQLNAFPFRLIFPIVGEGKCAEQNSVSVSQQRSSNCRRVVAASSGSVSNFGDSSG
jgi:hypothetical protein